MRLTSWWCPTCKKWVWESDFKSEKVSWGITHKCGICNDFIVMESRPTKEQKAIRDVQKDVQLRDQLRDKSIHGGV